MAEAEIKPKDGDEEEIDIDLGDEGEDKDRKPDGEGDEKKKPDFSNETPEQRSARLARMSDQWDKKHGLGKYKSDSKDEKPSKSEEGLDYGQLAYLKASGIESESEVNLVEKTMKDTGKDLKTLLGTGWFQSELKELRETDATAAATPKGNRRSGASASDSVEYWIAKGELPPADQRDLRQKVVNERMKKAGGGSPFTQNPVQGNYGR